MLGDTTGDMGDDPRIYSEIAGHRILEVIGSGGASVVYLAEQIRLGRNVALKVLSAQLAHDEGFRERFLRESHIAGGLEHPNIVPVYDAGEDRGELYLSMRYIRGSDLRQVIRSEGALDPSRTVAILSQVASALDAAHQEGLVHRDVKPANVLLTRDRGTGVEQAFLADFGLTKRVASRDQSLTVSGQFVGTVDYVAPEQILGGAVDARADVYSLGCVAFHCLVGKPPYGRPNEVGTLYAHVHEPPPRISRAGSSDLDRVIERALAKSPDERFGSCSELIKAVRSALQAEPILVSSQRGKEGVAIDEPETVIVHRARTRHEPSVLAAHNERRRFVSRPWIAAVVAGTIAIAVVTATLIRRPSPSGGDGTTASRSLVPRASEAEEAPRYSWQYLSSWQTDLSSPDENEAVISAIPTADGGLLGVGHADPTATDEDAAIWTSEDGLRWLRIDSDLLHEDGTQRLYEVVPFEEGYVAVGLSGDDAAVWATDSGKEGWHHVQTVPAEGLQVLRDILVVGGSLLAVGWSQVGDQVDAIVWRSTNGVDWDVTLDDDLSGPGDQAMWTVIQVEGAVVGLGERPDEFGTTDAASWVLEGSDWRPVRVGDPARGSQEIRDAVVSDDGVVVAVGINGAMAKRDAAIWTTTRDRPETWRTATGNLTQTGAQELLAVVSAEPGFVAMGWTSRPGTGRDALFWASADGRNWVTPEDPESREMFQLSKPGSEEVRSLVAFGHPSSLVALGTSGSDDENAEIWLGTRLSGTSS
jgi:serine/threonine protein kinase